MMYKSTPIISAIELLKIRNSNDLKLVDTRSGKDSAQRYFETHLAGAIHLELNDHLSEVSDDASIGGRHPLPKIENFLRTLAHFGLSKSDHIVIYDDKNGANAAARLWWMLSALGWLKVQVLDGGLAAGMDLGFPTETGVEVIEPVNEEFADNWQLPLAYINEVQGATKSQDQIIIDVREAQRYKGEIEPLDLIAGHIPNAINVPFSENLDSNGRFLKPEILKAKYLEIFKEKDADQIIVHCGSGVTACHTLLAIKYAGLNIPKLYVGSWSEWSRNNKQMITKIA